MVRVARSTASLHAWLTPSSGWPYLLRLIPNLAMWARTGAGRLGNGNVSLLSLTAEPGLAFLGSVKRLALVKRPTLRPALVKRPGISGCLQPATRMEHFSVQDIRDEPHGPCFDVVLLAPVCSPIVSSLKRCPQEHGLNGCLQAALRMAGKNYVSQGARASICHDLTGPMTARRPAHVAGWSLRRRVCNCLKELLGCRAGRAEI
jgi:hypothetical protein